LLDDARELVAEILGADLAPPRPDRVIFTSGGTEANNLAVLGIALADGAEPGQIVISAGEHQSVIGPAEHLLERGWRLDTLGLTPQGVVRVEQLPALIAAWEGEAPAEPCSPATSPQGSAGASPSRMRPCLVSVILGNHETGVLQPVAELAAICNEVGVPMHTDAAQVAGKLPLSFRALGVAAMTVAAHKFGGPLGIGALLLRDGVPLAPLMFGGHQQSGLRPGTESVALAVGMATALELCRKRQDQRARQLTSLRDRFEHALQAGLPRWSSTGPKLNGFRRPATWAFPASTARCFGWRWTSPGGLLGRRGLFERFDGAIADAPGDGPAQRPGGLFAAVQPRGHDHGSGNR